MNDTFTHDELIAALTAARTDGEDDPAAMTVQELVVIMGRNEVIVARRLRRLISGGQVETVRKPMLRIDGVQTTVPAYRLVRRGK